MARLTRRQFLGTAAAGAAGRVPSRLGPPGVGPGQGAPGPRAGATSCPPTTSGSTSGPGVERQERGQADHRPRPAPADPGQDRGRDRHPVRPRHRAAGRAPAPRSGPPPCSTSRTWPTSSARSTAAGRRWPRTTPRSKDGKFHVDSRLLHRLPRPLPEGPVDRGRHAERPRLLGRPAPGRQKLKAKGFPIGIGLAHHDDSRASWRAIMWSLRRLRGRQGRQDDHVQLQGSPRRAQVHTRRSTRRR